MPKFRSGVAPREATSWMRDVKRRRELAREVRAAEKVAAPPPVMRRLMEDGTWGDAEPVVMSPDEAASLAEKRQRRRVKVAAERDHRKAQKQRSVEAKSERHGGIVEANAIVEQMILDCLRDDPPARDATLKALRKIAVEFHKRAHP